MFFRVLVIIVLVSTGLSLIASILMMIGMMPGPENPSSPMVALQLAHPWLDIIYNASTIGLFTIFLSPKYTEIFFGRTAAQTRVERRATIFAGVMAVIMAVTGMFFVGTIIKSGIGGFFDFVSAIFLVYILWLGCKSILAEQQTTAPKDNNP